MVKVEYENDCVGCPMGCIECGRKHSKYYYLFCDKCGLEGDELYDVDGEQICENCLPGMFKKITLDNAEDFE